MPVQSQNRTITQVSIAQGAAGTTDLVAAPGAGFKIYVVTIVILMDVAGTIKFTEGTAPTDLTGALTVGTTSGFVITGSGIAPVMQTNTANSKLSIVSATGKATGWIRYFTTPE